MVCLGSKIKYANSICPILQKIIREKGIDTYIECFVGGANIIDKIKCKNKFGYDRSDTLIALLQQAVLDWDGVLKEGTRELWEKGKMYIKDGIKPTDMSLSDIGAMEYFASFSNGGFSYGYAKNTQTRNYFKDGYLSLKRQIPLLRDITFKCQNYWELEPVEGALIYLDPPHKNAKHKNYARQIPIDYEHFWQWARELSKKNYVIISEQVAPDDFEIIWRKETKKIGNTDNYEEVEKLFRWKEGLK